MTTPECRSDRVNQVTLAFDQSNCVVVSSGVINHTMFFFFLREREKRPIALLVEKRSNIDLPSRVFAYTKQQVAIF